MQKSTFFLTILFFLSCFFTAAQTSQVKFGKNRVQYHRDFAEWSQYESDNFITYWYDGGRNIGQMVVQLAELDFNYIQNILEHRVNEKIQIVVYKDLTDIKQSNIGSDEAFNNTGGQTKIVGNKIFVYFNGDHTDLRRQIREGIASVYLDAMLFGSNLQEIVQNAVMMNLPTWFKEGLIAFVGDRWNTESDNKLKSALLSNDFRSFDRFAEDNPKLAGHSLWYFIDQNFGGTMVSNLLYLTRINRSVESGFLYVLGNSYEAVVEEWYNFYYERYQVDLRSTQAPENEIAFKNKRQLPVSEVKLSPNGRQIVYVTNEIGKYKVYLQDIVEGDRKLIFKGGFRNAFQATDYNYPLLAWNPNGQEIAIMYEKRDVAKLMLYDATTGKSETEDVVGQYQRIYSMDFINPNTLVISGAVNGYSDLFLYYPRSRNSQRITNDFYDDLDASFVKLGNKRGILFTSNRTDSVLFTARTLRADTVLPINNFDVYYYDLEEKSPELIRITNTPLANERYPVAIDTAYFSYTSDQSGVYNRMMGYLEDYVHHYDQVVLLKDGTEITLHIDSTLASIDSTLIDTVAILPVIKKRAITYANTNFDHSILEQHTAPRANKLIDLIYRDDNYRFYSSEINVDTMRAPLFTSFQQTRMALWGEQLSQFGGQNLPPSGSLTAPPPPGNRPSVPERQEVLEEKEVIPQEAPAAAETETAPVDTIPNRPLILFQAEFDDRDLVKKPVKTGAKPTIKMAEPEPVEQTPPPPATFSDPLVGNDQQSIYRFRPARITPYRLEFRTDYVTTQLDNSLLFEGLDSYTDNINNRGQDGNPDVFGYPPPGILLKANFKDLFEDYEFEGGIRIPTTFNGLEYFLVYNDKKTRLDKTYAVYSRLRRYSLGSIPGIPVSRRDESNILLGQFGVRYPLDIFRSVRATATIRQDKLTHLATELNTLNDPSTREQRASIKLEYVFDNTLDVSLNIKNGTRYKIYAEVMKRFEVSLSDGASFDLSQGAMGVLGLDARHYQRVLKHSVFATRLAAATTFGSERILYYLGGVDNWLFNSFNQDIPQPQGVDFAFETTAPNLRGFDFNIRNGNSYALINSELRVPVVRYLSRRVRSSFLRNLQLVGFFDVGTAWEGKDPFSDDNPLNTKEFQNAPTLTVKVNFFRDPIVAGYGFGLRSMLFGYFVRVDYAWGIETRQVLDPRLFIALGMDF